MPNKEDEIGAIWKRTSRDGKTYYTGQINGQDVVMFENNKGDNDKRPDFRIYKSQPRE